MVKLKTIPEEFVVVEEMALPLDPSGAYAYYRLVKKGLSTLDAIEQIAEYFQIPSKFINAAGLKDTIAITTQFISISRGPQRGIQTKNFTLEYLGNGKDRLSMGGLLGNHFEIVVRKAVHAPRSCSQFPNYFDLQRFGIHGTNQDIGKFLLQRNYDTALKILQQQQEIKGDFKSSVEAIRTLPKQKLLLYLHAYQSYLWNRVVSEYLHSQGESFQIRDLVFPHNKLPSIEIPILGFMTDLSAKPFGAIYSSFLSEDRLTQRSFLLHELNGISVDGNTRSLCATIENLEISPVESDELHVGKSKYRLRFFLGRGSYATMAVKALFGEDTEQ